MNDQPDGQVDGKTVDACDMARGTELLPMVAGRWLVMFGAGLSVGSAFAIGVDRGNVEQSTIVGFVVFALVFVALGLFGRLRVPRATTRNRVVLAVFVAGGFLASGSSTEASVLCAAGWISGGIGLALLADWQRRNGPEGDARG